MYPFTANALTAAVFNTFSMAKSKVNCLHFHFQTFQRFDCIDFVAMHLLMAFYFSIVLNGSPC